MSTPTAHAHWLNAERRFAYPIIFLICYAALALAIALYSKDGVMPRQLDSSSGGMPVGADFIVFWSASHIALHGNAADAYQLSALFEAQRIAVPDSTARYFWPYPPTFLLAVLPLALLPYLTAYIVFQALTLTAFLVAMRPAVPEARAWLLLLAFPAVAINFASGQNAFLTAALAGLAMTLLDRRPIAAGVLIGLLSIKPHLALLFPLVLLISRRWVTFVVAASTALALVAICLGAFGPDVFEAFFRSTGFTRSALESGGLPWAKMPSVFVGMRLLGVPIIAAYAVHILLALFAVGACALVWAKEASERLRGSILFVTTFLISPYSYWYDLIWLAFPIAWVALEGMETGWRSGERETLVAAWLMPILFPRIATVLRLPVAPVVLMAFAALILRRFRSA